MIHNKSLRPNSPPELHKVGCRCHERLTAKGEDVKASHTQGGAGEGDTKGEGRG
jgi:hypothetical protein